MKYKHKVAMIADFDQRQELFELILPIGRKKNGSYFATTPRLSSNKLKTVVTAEPDGFFAGHLEDLKGDPVFEEFLFIDHFCPQLFAALAAMTGEFTTGSILIPTMSFGPDAPFRITELIDRDVFRLERVTDRAVFHFDAITIGKVFRLATNFEVMKRFLDIDASVMKGEEVLLSRKIEID